MKRVLATILALVMMFSLCVTASAEESTDGSITITNATIGVTYNLYKFFNAAYAVDDDDNLILDADGKATVAYTVDSSNQFFEAMFGADGTAANPYFNYVKDTGVVTKKSTASDSDVIAYLDNLAKNGTPIATKTASASEVKFDGLDTGYYLVDKGVDSTVTITTNMPDVDIIDKNQIPGTGFDKVIDEILNKEDIDISATGSASIGNEIHWDINFAATNYHEDEIVEYYIIRDIKTSSVWVEFDDISVTVYQKDANGDNTINKDDATALEGNTDPDNGVTVLDRGYYHLVNPAIATDPPEWDYIGDWSGITKDPANAQWFLIHYGYDEFAIVIPWLDDFVFTGNTTSYDLDFDLKDGTDGNSILSEPIYEPNTFVQVNYFGVVGPDAPTVGVSNNASLEWVTDENTHPGGSEGTETQVYNLGITKTANDASASRLAGAVFGIYADEACTKPIYVIPTNNPGVYILDDLAVDVSGEKRNSAREMYEEWLTAEYTDSLGNPVGKNTVTTPPVSGQVVVLGLAAGTYYIKELEAPSGYNKLPNATAITVGTGSLTTYDNGYKGLDDDTNPDNDPDITFNAYGTTIQNSKGVELPSTGGAGTVKMITIGTLVAMAFAVLLITHKKMSIYHD